MTPQARRRRNDILKLRPGEVDGRNLRSRRCLAIRTMDEVARILGTSMQNVQQIERKALNRLRSNPDLQRCALACWCKPGTLCHADVLLEIANGE